MSAHLGDLSELRAQGALSDLDVELARSLTRLSGDRDPRVALGVAVASRAVARGDVCADLHALAGRPVELGDGSRSSERAWPLLPEWLDALSASRLVERAGSSSTTDEGPPPLVLDPSDRLYLRRYWRYEERVVEIVEALSGARVDVDPGTLGRLLLRLFPDATTPDGRPNMQRVAAATAALRRLAVITGGPGTGKTATVVRVLALLIELAGLGGDPVPRVALVAPTGKAAARLSESIRVALEPEGPRALDCGAEVLEAIPLEASTVHRLLGWRPRTPTRFRHDRENPLPVDVLVVDEASMLDLSLFAKLLSAVPRAARVILLGDRNQLASVEAGSVLAELCGGGHDYGRGEAFTRELETVCGLSLGLDDDDSNAPPSPGLSDALVDLRYSYRFAERGAVGSLAEAIRAGDSDRVMSLLATGSDDPAGDVSLRLVDDTESLEAEVQGIALHGYAPYMEAATSGAPLQERLARFDTFRVLSALRRGPSGAEQIATRLAAGLAADHGLDANARWYPGQAVMVRANDYSLRLFNGDVGLVVEAPSGSDTSVEVVFPGPDGELRHLSPARLPPHDDALSMTIHKSQGSEFDELLIVLPVDTSPIVTRELLYTAVTRAKRGLTIVASEATIREGVNRRVERASGLRERLWGE